MPCNISAFLNNKGLFKTILTKILMGRLIFIGFVILYDLLLLTRLLVFLIPYFCKSYLFEKVKTQFFS